MDNNELKNIRRDESSSALQPLNHDFFASVDKYIRELEDEIKKINNPRSVESKMLDDELQSAINNVEDIFMLRIRKITSRATSHAFSNRSSKSDLDKLLPVEKKVYDAVMSAINMARNELLEPILNPGTVPAARTVPEAIQTSVQKKPDVPIPSSPDAQKKESVAQTTNDGSKGDIAKSDINKEYLVVRILKDMPTFKAVDDRNYTLHADDVVVLPSLNARGLVKRNIAKLIPVK